MFAQCRSFDKRALNFTRKPHVHIKEINARLFFYRYRGFPSLHRLIPSALETALMVSDGMQNGNHFDTIKNTITKGMLPHEQRIYEATAYF